MSAIEDIAAERKRQVEREGWSAAHDDKKESGGQLVAGACGYALASVPLPNRAADIWPWPDFPLPVRDDTQVGKRDARSLLVKAGALIVAEIERLDRAASTQ